MIKDVQDTQGGVADMFTYEDKIDDAFEDLMVGHNFDYVSNEIKRIIAQVIAETLVWTTGGVKEFTEDGRIYIQDKIKEFTDKGKEK